MFKPQSYFFASSTPHHVPKGWYFFLPTIVPSDAQCSLRIHCGHETPISNQMICTKKTYQTTIKSTANHPNRGSPLLSSFIGACDTTCRACDTTCRACNNYPSKTNKQMLLSHGHTPHPTMFGTEAKQTENVLSLSRNENKPSRNSFRCGSSEKAYCCKIEG